MSDKINRAQGRPGGFGGGPGHHGRFVPGAKAKKPKETIKRLWGYIKLNSRMLLLVFILVIISSVFALIGPLLIGSAIDNYIIPGNLRGLAGISAILLATYLVSTLSSWMQQYLMISVAQSTVRTIRKELFDKLQTLPLNFFDTKLHGDLMSRFTNDVENVSNTLNNSVTHIFASVITFVGTLGMMLYLSPLLTLLTMIVIPLMFIITTKIAGRTRKLFAEQQKVLGELNGFIEENISGQKVVKVFSREDEGIEVFEKSNVRLKKVGFGAQVFSGIIQPLMNILNNISFAIVAGVGGYLAVSGVITVGVIASFIQYSKQFARPLNELANQFNMLQSALAGSERVFAILDEASELADEHKAHIISQVSGEVIFKDVNFSYIKGTPVLKDVDFNVKPGQTIALVGPTGAGKTTIVNLLTRFYDIDEGSITIDGVDIRDLQRNSLRSSLGIVLQDTYLFSDSVRENIRYGRLNASNTEIENAAKIANAHEFITRLPEGYDTVLSQDGGNLSQGQRQLLSIARAVLADPAILILDEATSNVDTRTELHIQEAMLLLMRGRTSFVIAHRLSTIKNADVIFVINDGMIIEKGTHEALIEEKGFYYDLYNSQFRRQAS